MRPLPYRARTATGDVFDITFPLHDDTASAMRTEQMLTAVLDALDRDIKVCGETSNGDVLQALAMAIAVRARMVHAPGEATAKMAEDLVRQAAAAAVDAERTSLGGGNA